MPDLNSSTSYDTGTNIPDPTNISSMYKNLISQTPASPASATNTAASTINDAITNHFNPTEAKSIFGEKPTSANMAGNGPSQYGTPIAEQTPVGTPPPAYERFFPTTKNDGWALPSGTQNVKTWDSSQQPDYPGQTYENTPIDTKSVLKNWPTTLGGGQYVTDPTLPGEMLKSGRVLMNDKINPGGRLAALGGLDPRMFQMDHIIPLELGGADTAANLEIYSTEQNAEKQRVQAVPMMLLINHLYMNPDGTMQKLDPNSASDNAKLLSQARAMAFNWKAYDSSGLPSIADMQAKYKGLVPLDAAITQAKKWNDTLTQPINSVLDPRALKYFGSSFVENMGNFGKGWLPTPVREFLKGLVGGGTAGIVPGTNANPNEGVIAGASNIAGNIAGTITGLGLLSKGIGAGARALGIIKGADTAATIADGALKESGLVTDIGNLTKGAISKQAAMQTFTKMVKTAGLLSTWGQLGLTGRNLTGQDQFEFKNNVSQFLKDVAFGSLLGSAKQTIPGYATVGLGTAALSVMEGQDIVPALKNAALMTALHGLAYKNGDVSKLTLGNEEAYKASAVAMNQYLGDDIIPTVKKGETVPNILKLDIPKIDAMLKDFQSKYPDDQRFKGVPTITNEAQALQFMENAARQRLGQQIAKSNGAMPIEDIKNETTRIITARNQLENQTLDPKARQQKEWKDLLSLGEKLRPKTTSSMVKPATDVTTLLNNVPFNVPNETISNINNTKFITGNVPSTGYGANIDTVSAKTIDDYYKNPENFSNKVYIVKDPDVSSMMRLIQQEQIYNGGKGGGKPTTGNPNDALRIYIKEQTPDGVVVRPMGYIPQEVSFNAKTNPLNKLYFEVMNRLRTTIKASSTVEELLKKLGEDKSQVSASDKEIQDLFNNKANLVKMTDEQLYSLLKPKNIEKFDSNLNNSNISQEMDKNGIKVLIVNSDKVLPTGSATPRANPNNPYLTINLNETDWLRSIQMNSDLNKPLSPMEEGIKNLASMGKANSLVNTAGNIVKKIAPRITIKPPRTVVEAPKTPETTITPSESEKSEVIPKPAVKIPPKSVIDELVQKGKITAKEASPYLAMEQHFSDLTKAMGERNLKPSEVKEMGTISKDLNKFLQDKGIIKKPVPKYNRISDSVTISNKNQNSLLKDALTQAEDDIEKMKSKATITSPESFRSALSSATNGARSMINSNKLNLSSSVQRTLLEAFNNNVDNIITKHVDDAFDRSIDLSGNKYSSQYHQYVGVDPKTGNEIPIKQVRDEAKPVKEPNQTEDQKLAKKYDLALKDDGYLKLEQGKPVFSDEYLAKHPTQTKTPLSVFGSILQKDLDVNKDFKTKNSENFTKELDVMAKAPGTYKIWAETLQKILKKVIIDPQEPWLKKAMGGDPGKSFTFNSLMRNNSSYMKRMFETVNSKGHPLSQPAERIIAQVEGASPEDLKRIDEKTKAVEEKAAENRAARGDEPLTQEDIRSEGVSPEDLKGMSIKDTSQMEKVQDLTNFEMKFPSFLYEELTGKNPPKEAIINDAIRAGKDFMANYNANIKKGGKIGKTFINSKQWDDIKQEMIENKSDGKGGLYDGMGGIKKIDTTKFVIIRHGATANNELGLNRGMTNINLSKLGVEQAVEAGKEISKLGITGLIASPLKRAKDTAEIISRETGIPIIETNKGLLPWDLGEFQGKSIKDTLPALHHLIVNETKKAPGGESFKTFKERGIKGLEEIHKKYPNEKLGLVSHHRIERLIEAHANDKGGHGNFHLQTQLEEGINPGKIKEHKWKNLFPKKYDGKGGVFDNAINGLRGLISSHTTFKTPTPILKQKSPYNLDLFKKAIAANETSIVKGNKSLSHQPSSLGQARGVYRVTDATLKAFSPQYLGRNVTPHEFQNSPKLQDEWMNSFYSQLYNKGYSPQQMADIHRSGIGSVETGNMYLPTSTQYKNPQYVDNFNDTYNKPETPSTNPVATNDVSLNTSGTQSTSNK